VPPLVTARAVNVRSAATAVVVQAPQAVTPSGATRRHSSVMPSGAVKVHDTVRTRLGVSGVSVNAATGAPVRSSR
jgi:microcystin-dependent protein